MYYTELAWSDSLRNEVLRGGEHEASVERWTEMPGYLEAIAASGDPDSIYGSNTTVDAESLVRTYEHEHKWGKAMALYDDAVASSDASTGIGAVVSDTGRGRSTGMWSCML